MVADSEPGMGGKNGPSPPGRPACNRARRLGDDRDEPAATDARRDDQGIARGAARALPGRSDGRPGIPPPAERPDGLQERHPDRAVHPIGDPRERRGGRAGPTPGDRHRGGHPGSVRVVVPERSWAGVAAATVVHPLSAAGFVRGPLRPRRRVGRSRFRRGGDGRLAPRRRHRRVDGRGRRQCDRRLRDRNRRRRREAGDRHRHRSGRVRPDGRNAPARSMARHDAARRQRAVGRSGLARTSLRRD